MKRPPFRYIGVEPSHETVELLAELLDQARAGELIGVAFVSVRRARSFSIGYTGECRRSPAFTLGTLKVMEYDIVRQLSENQHQGREGG